MASLRWFLGVFVSGGLHVVAFACAGRADAAAVRTTDRPIVIEVDTSPPPPPVPVDPERLPEPESPTSVRAAHAPSPSPRSPPAPPRAAAQAGTVLAAEADSADVADFTMVQGSGATYAGGVTSANGTSRSEPRGMPRVAAAVAARDAERAGGSGGPDRSRPARPAASDWDCSSLFPASATVDAAVVVVVARVREDGTAESITVLSDVAGFAAAARACGLRQRYLPAADRDGRSIVATTAPFRVRFTR
jgi:outer membrane biosynthesis protein TonB